MLARLVRLVLDVVPGPVTDRLRRTPVLAPLLRLVLGAASKSLHGSVVPIAQGPAAGLLLLFDETSAVWVSGRTESGVQRALEQLLEPGSVFFDVGANVGFFTILGSRLVGDSGTVVAFEPHPLNVEALRRHVELNSLSNVEVVATAVSDLSGDRVLDGSHTATAALLPAGHAVSREDQVLVAATPLDDFLAGRPGLEPAVVKIDAEGHEVEVVRGMAETLRRAAPVLLCEMHGREREFDEVLRDAGYETTRLRRSRGHVIAAPLAGTREIEPRGTPTR